MLPLGRAMAFAAMDALQLYTQDGVSEVSHHPSREDSVGISTRRREEAERRRARGVLRRSGRECGLGVHTISMQCLYLCSCQRVKDALFKERRRNKGMERWRANSEEHLLLLFPGTHVEVPAPTGSSQLALWSSRSRGSGALFWPAVGTHSAQADKQAEYLSNKYI